MANRKFNLSTTEINELKAAYQQCQNGPTKIRYQAVRLYGTGYPVAEIEEICGCRRPSLMEWCRAYRQYGVAGLVDQRRGGNRAKLTPIEIEHIKQRLEMYSPRSCGGQPTATVQANSGQFRIWPGWLNRRTKSSTTVTLLTAPCLNVVISVVSDRAVTIVPATNWPCWNLNNSLKKNDRYRPGCARDGLGRR